MNPRLGIIGLTGLAVVLRLWALSGPEPIGTDGYYYVVQIEDVVATGALHVPDGSPTLRALALPHALGMAPIRALALAASVLAALAVPAAAFLDRHRALALAAVVAASPTLTHLAADFPKSLGCAAPLLFGIGALARTSRDPRWGLVGATCLLLAAACHRLGAVFALLIATGWLLSHAGKRSLVPLAAVAVLVAIFLAVATMTPGWLHPSDLARVHGQLRSAPWPLPPWSWAPLRPGTSAVQLLELATPWPALGALPWAWQRHRAIACMLGAALLPVWFPLYATDSLDLGYRVSLFGPLFAVPLVVLALPDRLPLGALAVGAPLALWGPDPASTPPYDTYRAVLDRIPEPLPELLIAHQGMNFLYDHRTGREAMAWAPEAELDRTRIGRVTWGIRPGEWLAVHPDGAPDVIPLGHGYHYVREDVWEALVGGAPGDDALLERIEDWRNPSVPRPRALVRARD